MRSKVKHLEQHIKDLEQQAKRAQNTDGKEAQFSPLEERNTRLQGRIEEVSAALAKTQQQLHEHMTGDRAMVSQLSSAQQSVILVRNQHLDRLSPRG